MSPSAPTPAPSKPGLPAYGPPPWLPIRTLHEGHRSRILAHLLTLDGPAIAARFGHAISPERLGQYVASMDFDLDAFLGVFDRRLQLVALGHLAFERASDAPRTNAEFGLSVSASLRGRGVGTRLLAHAVTIARNRGLQTLNLQFANANAAMHALALRAGADCEVRGSETLATLPLPDETLGSQWAERIGRQAAEWDYRLKRQSRRSLAGTALGAKQQARL